MQYEVINLKMEAIVNNLPKKIFNTIHHYLILQNMEVSMFKWHYHEMILGNEI